MAYLWSCLVVGCLLLSYVVVIVVLLYYRFTMSVRFYFSFSADIVWCGFGSSHYWGYCGRYSSPSTVVYWMQSPAWDCTQWMGVILWVRYVASCCCLCDCYYVNYITLQPDVTVVLLCPNSPILWKTYMLCNFWPQKTALRESKMHVILTLNCFLFLTRFRFWINY